MRALLGPVVLVAAAGLLGACGPIPLPRAEAQCYERARLAQRPRGEAYFGATTAGPAAGLTLTVTSDYLQGRDPAAVYDACVFQKSGLPPSQPLYARPDWKG